MLRDRAKELLPIITAFAEGKQVEYRTTSDREWHPATDPSWSSQLEYRIKPEPREWIVGVPNKADFRKAYIPQTESRFKEYDYIKVREVLDD